MHSEHGLSPNALCFKFVLQCCAQCRPPKYEEALSILRRMRSDWQIAPNAYHLSAALHCIATPFALIDAEWQLSEDIAAHAHCDFDYDAFKRMFQFSLKLFQQRHVRAFMNFGNDDEYFVKFGDIAQSAPNEFKDNEFGNAWEYYVVEKFESERVAALFWSAQIERALQFYDDFYAQKKASMHWFEDEGRADRAVVDLHQCDVAVAAVAMKYILEREAEVVALADER